MWRGCTRFKCIAMCIALSTESPTPLSGPCLNPSLRDLSTTSAPHASITPHRPLRLPRTLWLFTLFTLFPRSTVRVLCVGGVPRALRVRVFAVRRDLLVGRCAEQGHAGLRTAVLRCCSPPNYLTIPERSDISCTTCTCTCSCCGHGAKNRGESSREISS